MAELRLWPEALPAPATEIQPAAGSEPVGFPPAWPLAATVPSPGASGCSPQVLQVSFPVPKGPECSSPSSFPPASLSS